MDEIFLRDYNNVALAQEPTGLAAVQSQPGFENYTPSFSVVDQPLAMGGGEGLTPMGLQNNSFTDTGTQLPDFKQIGKDILIDQAKKQFMKKAGLEGIKGNVLASVLGTSPLSLTNPIGAAFTFGSLLPDSVKGIAGLLRGKRASKAIQKDIARDSQGDITTYDIKTANIQPTPQDLGRGNQYNKTSSPAPSAPAARQSRQTSGPGGLHSGY